MPGCRSLRLCSLARAINRLVRFGFRQRSTIDSLPDAIKQLTHQFVRVLAGRNVDLDGPPDLFRYLLYEDGQPVEAGIDDLRIETALVRQGDRLQVSHAAGDGQPFAIR